MRKRILIVNDEANAVQHMSRTDYIRAVEEAGSVNAFAAQMGVKPSTVYGNLRRMGMRVVTTVRIVPREKPDHE